MFPSLPFTEKHFLFLVKDYEEPETVYLKLPGCPITVSWMERDEEFYHCKQFPECQRIYIGALSPSSIRRHKGSDDISIQSELLYKRRTKGKGLVHFEQAANRTIRYIQASPPSLGE
jgi:hypothetical protein